MAEPTLKEFKFDTEKEARRCAANQRDYHPTASIKIEGPAVDGGEWTVRVTIPAAGE